MTLLVIIGLAFIAVSFWKFASVIWNPKQIPNRSDSAPPERTGTGGSVY